MSNAYIVYRSDYHMTLEGFDHVFTSLDRAIDYATDLVWRLSDGKYSKDWIKNEYRKSFKNNWLNEHNEHWVDYTSYYDMDYDSFVGIQEIPFD